jgi:hypothetical protein
LEEKDSNCRAMMQSTIADTEYATGRNDGSSYRLRRINMHVFEALKYVAHSVYTKRGLVGTLARMCLEGTRVLRAFNMGVARTPCHSVRGVNSLRYSSSFL